MVRYHVVVGEGNYITCRSGYPAIPRRRDSRSWLTHYSRTGYIDVLYFPGLLSTTDQSP